MIAQKTREQPAHRGDETHLLREIIRTYQALMAGFSRGVGIPASRFVLMRLLATAERDVGVMDLARQLGINAAAVTRQVKELESAGLLQRRTDPKDGRRTHVALSPKGLKSFEVLHERTHAIERGLSTSVTHSEIAVTMKVLSKLRSFLEEQP